MRAFRVAPVDFVWEAGDGRGRARPWATDFAARRFVLEMFARILASTEKRNRERRKEQMESSFVRYEVYIAVLREELEIAEEIEFHGSLFQLN